LHGQSNTFGLRSPKAIHLLPEEHGEILGRLEVGWEKVACWSTKAAISLKRLKTEETLLRTAYRNSPTLFRTVQSPTPYGLDFKYNKCSFIGSPCRWSRSAKILALQVQRRKLRSWRNTDDSGELSQRREVSVCH